jgi:hypothetical protein
MIRLLLCDESVSGKLDLVKEFQKFSPRNPNSSQREFFSFLETIQTPTGPSLASRVHHAI